MDDLSTPLEPIAAHAPPVRRAAASPNQVLAIVCVGIVLANLDLFIVNVGLPNIGRDFRDASLEDLSWILNGYAIAYAALLVFFGRLAERHRRDRSFLLWIALFTAASAACAAANSVVRVALMVSAPHSILPSNTVTSRPWRSNNKVEGMPGSPSKSVPLSSGSR